MSDQEIEVKFYINDLERIRKRLEALGAVLAQPRVLETNLRFDTPDQALARSFRVLRLRQDTNARLTFKGPAQASEGARIRQEIEFTVEDFDRARAFLEALGYRLSLAYEKYRMVYDLDGVHVTLDTMPYGDFVELEGPNVPALQSVDRKLELDWEAGVPASYTVLFEQLKTKLNLLFRDLTFENFRNVAVTPADLGVRAAD